MAAPSRRSRVPLAEKTSFRIGGVAANHIELECLPEAVSAASAELRKRDCFMLGGGTNVLVADSGYDGTIAQFGQHARVEALGSARYRVSANASLDELASHVSRAGFYGLERLAGIPGSVGGAIVQNAGAYDYQLGDIIESVVCFDCRRAQIEHLSVSECALSYRDSVFKRSPGSKVIVECTLDLKNEPLCEISSFELMAELERRGETRGSAAPPDGIGDAVRSVRARRDHLLQPANNPSAGSFFKNPRSTASHPTLKTLVRNFEARRNALIASGANWIGSKADVVRRHEGEEVELIASLLIATAHDPSEPGAAYWPCRAFGALRLGAGGANTIVNTGDATASDVVGLATNMQRAVLAAYGLKLDPEVVLLGEFSLEYPRQP